MTDKQLLSNAINSAKNFENFQDVLMAVSLHPEWLTIIPDERRWAILHQIIFSGNVNHLDQLLALQKSNKEFRLFTNTRDGQSILDIAKLRPDVPQMITSLEKLIKLDEMLNYAKDCEWNKCYNLVKENPTLVNEKPPYRRYYLIHHMAVDNAKEEFKRFKQIKGCIFNSTLQADRKKINTIAREEKQPEFAELMEKEFPNLLDKLDLETDDLCKPSEEAIKQTKVITLIVQQNIVKDLDEDLMGKSVKPKTRVEVMKQLAVIRSEQNDRDDQISKSTLQEEENKRKLLVLDNLTCPLTLAIFIDPVVAADGFTYERRAITKWLQKNDHSPMTNQPFTDKQLNPNNVIKQIITALQPKS